MDKFKEIWANSRYKAAIKLCGWFLFLMIILIFCSVSSNNNHNTVENNKEENKIVFASFAEMQKNLLNKNYKYTYKFANNKSNNLIVYNGEINDGVDTGYYESKTETYKYSCYDEKCYKLFTDHQEEIEMKSPIITSIKNLIDLLAVKTLNEEINDDTKVYSFSMDENNKKIKITTSLTDITNIKVDSLDETYEISFEY